MSADVDILMPEQVTAKWLTAALRHAGVDATVSDFTMDQVGTGQLGETRRFHLTYDGATPDDAPKTVVGKFPSHDEVAATTGREMGSPRRNDARRCPAGAHR